MTYVAAAAGALGAGLILLARSRVPLLAGLALLLVAEAALLAEVSSGAEVDALVRSPAGLAALVAGAAGLAGLAALLVRHPIAAAPLALLVAPLRPPLELGAGGPLPVALDTSGKLGRLLPLYAVLAAAVLALGWRVARGMGVRPLPRSFAMPAAAFLAVTIASVAWAIDRPAAASQLIFFWLPFAALLGTLARTPVDEPRLARLLALALVGSASVFAAIGLVQAATRTVFFASPDLAAGNAYGSLFRVTSLFDDPSHYGRYLVLAMAVVLVALWLGRARVGPAVAVLALLGAGLWFSYSQSSTVTLVAVSLAVALLAGDRRARRLAAVATAIVALAAAALVGVQLTAESEREVTSERSRLVEDSVRVYVAYPLAGVGVGGQPRASQQLEGEPRALRRSASHTTPMTVAAELGTLGLVGYVALLLGTARMLAVAHRRDPALALGLAAVLFALFVHSLFYGGFFDNPLTWIALAVGAGVSGAAAAARTEAETSDEAGVWARPPSGPGAAGPRVGPASGTSALVRGLRPLRGGAA